MIPVILGVLGGILCLFLSQEPSSFSISWFEKIGLSLSFNIDSLSQIFLFAIGCVTIFLFPYSYLYFKKYRNRTLYTLLVFLIGMVVSVTTSNLLALFIFWELTSLTSFLLIGTQSESEYARKSARVALLVTAIGGAGLLVAAIVVFLEVGTLDFNSVSSHPVVIFGILLAALTKSAQFPFHFWLPGAMAAPTPISAYLHSATMVKLGVYLLLRFSGLFPPEVLTALVYIGAFTFVLTAIRAYYEEDLKKLLAFTTTSALGLMVALVGLSAHKEALVFFLSHVFYKGALFMILGYLYWVSGTYKLKELGHPASYGRLITFGLIVSLGSMIGVFPLLGFIGKEVILEALLRGASNPLQFSLILLGLLITGGVAARVGFILFTQERLPASKSFSQLAILGSALIFGSLVLPFFVTEFFARFSFKVALWHGFSVAFFGSLVLLCAGLLAGIYHTQIIKYSEAFLRVVTFLQFDGQFSRWTDNFLVWCKNLSKKLQPERITLYIRIMLVSIVILVGSQTSLLTHVPEASPLTLPSFLACFLIILGAVSATAVRSRLSSILMVSISGLGITLLFAQFGAPDLAITQILVEAVTLLLFVLFMRRLPDFRPKVIGQSQVWNLIVAISVGLVVMLVTYTTENQLNERPLQDFFFDNAYARAFGENVVNTILVDFRALDTLGEITVLALAAIGVNALLRRT